MLDFPYSPVLEAHVCLHISNLIRLQKKRARCILDLEHSLAQQALLGKRPKHLMLKKAIGTSVFNYQEKFEVDAIDHFTEELRLLNGIIAGQLDEIAKKQRPDLSRSLAEPIILGLRSASRESEGLLTALEQNDTGQEIVNIDSADDPEASNSKELNGTSTIANTSSLASNLVSNTVSTLSSAGKTVKMKAIKKAKKRARQAHDTVTAAADMLSSALLSEEDGTADDAGFVTFTNLVTTHSALQMSQHSDPFVLEILPAPDEPRYIFWGNVGKNKEVLQTGRYISLAATVAICLCWTFLVSFIVSLQTLDDSTDGVQYAVVHEILAVLSPMILLIFNSGLLPIILKAVSRFECPPSDSLLEASAFWKMATFNIIHTFLYVVAG